MITDIQMNFIDYLLNDVLAANIEDGYMLPEFNKKYDKCDAVRLLELYDIDPCDEYVTVRENVDETFINLLTDNMNFFIDENYTGREIMFK